MLGGLGAAAPRVEFENTNYPGASGKFARLTVPGGGLLYPSYDVNHSYVDCDVFVSIAKYKDHPTTGVTTVMKNLFGLTPLMVYGNFAGKWEENDLVAGANVVNTAAVAVAAMNYDPRAPRGAVPFERCDNKLLLAEQIGAGSCDLSRIEVIGPSVADVRFDFRALREKQRGLRQRPSPSGRSNDRKEN
jgi:hypothetical protein